MKRKKIVTRFFGEIWYLFLLAAISNNYCDGSDMDVEKAIHTLVSEYPEGEEISRAKAAGVDYRPICVRQSLVLEKILTEEESKKIFGVDGKLDKKSLRTKIYKNPFTRKLSVILEKIKQSDPAKNSKAVDDFTKLIGRNPEELISTDSSVVDIALQALEDSRSF